MRHAAPPRYEFKLRCEPIYLDQVHAWVRLHPELWRVAYPRRQINNIYFDTYGYDSLNDNLGGIGIRRKLRLRWYGPMLKTVANARLELKCKDGLVGWKLSCPLSLEMLDLARQSWSELRKAIQGAVDARANLWMAQFAFPVLINHYQRAYYVTPDQTLRMTIDSELCAYDQRFSTQPNSSRPLPIADRVIVELKADRQHYTRLENVLAHFPIRIDRYSKYVDGMLAAPDFDQVGLL